MSSSAAKKRGLVGLQGARPRPLSLADAASPPRPCKRLRGDDDGPVIVYEHTPKVLHARPDEFKALVQRLTGQQQQQSGDQETVPLPPSTETTAEVTATAGGEGDPLVLALGKQEAAPQPWLDGLTPVLLPSPGALAAGGGGSLLSPGSFLLSPATMQAIRELIS